MPAVLLVEDDPDVRGMIAFTLDDYGFTVEEAADGKAAVAALERGEPDAIVLDLMLPEIDGFGVLAIMRERGLAPRSRVLIVSCKVAEADLIRGFELGAHDYITKPFDPDSLASAVSRLLP